VYLDWAPDGLKLLAMVESLDDSRCLWLVPLKGASKRFFHKPALVDPMMSWLGDSRHIVISALSSVGADQGLQVIDTESEQVMPLLPSATMLGGPAVSRDGKRIAFVKADAVLGIAEIPLGGGAPSRLSPSHVDQSSFRWARAWRSICILSIKPVGRWQPRTHH
jgi:Tol biopolymer transport system component